MKEDTDKGTLDRNQVALDHMNSLLGLDFLDLFKALDQQHLLTNEEMRLKVYRDSKRYRLFYASLYAGTWATIWTLGYFFREKALGYCFLAVFCWAPGFYIVGKKKVQLNHLHILLALRSRDLSQWREVIGFLDERYAPLKRPHKTPLLLAYPGEAVILGELAKYVRALSTSDVRLPSLSRKIHFHNLHFFAKTKLQYDELPEVSELQQAVEAWERSHDQ